MKTITLAALATVLTLAACASPDSGTPEPAPAEQSQNGGEGTRFTCENGLSVQVRSLSNSQIELRLDDKQAVLNSAVAASGERYTATEGLFGKGAEWHQKGGEAYFEFTDPYGNKVNTTCRS